MDYKTVELRDEKEELLVPQEVRRHPARVRLNDQLGWCYGLYSPKLVEGCSPTLISTILHSLGPLPRRSDRGNAALLASVLQYRRPILPTCFVVVHKDPGGRE
jgi:hypothetical protein